MKKILTLICALVALAATAQTFTPTSADEMTQGGVTVSFGKGSGNNAPTWYENGLRLYASNTITVSGDSLGSVELVFCKQGTKAYATLTASAGTLVSGGESTAATDLKTDSWTGDAATSVTFTIGASGQRLIKQIIVNGDTTGTGSSTPDPETPDTTVTPQPSTDLDTAYVYAEPTTVGVPATSVSKSAYEFVENNIKVSCTQGAVYADYFNCYAGYAITFTATRPIKGLTVNGLIKKAFSATASAGTLAYADASEEDIEGDPVLMITDIDSTSVTLSCVKQIRFYSIDFYFEENPDAELGGGDEGYSYEWEPTDTTTFNLTIDSLNVVDMTENLGYKAVYLQLWNDDAELDLVAFADYAEATGIALGTYTIDSTYQEGTVQASVGGDEYYDYESYLMTNYTYNAEEDQWYYDPYYLVSGTVTVTASELIVNATSYNGSTINATYTFPAETGVEQSECKMHSVKRIENGQLIITRNGKRYNAIGQSINSL